MLSIGQACEVKWREASGNTMTHRLASLQYAGKIQALRDGVNAIAVSQRKDWLAKAAEDHEGDVEGWIHARAKTPFDKKTGKYAFEAPRVVTVSTQPVRGTRLKIIVEVASEFRIADSVVDNLWQAYRRFERESRDSNES